MLLREAFESYVRSPEHKPRTVETYHEVLSHWERTSVSLPTPDGMSLRLRPQAINPSAELIDSQSMVDFKNALLRKLSANTVRKNLIHLRAILYRLGPRSIHNPLGLGLIPDVPYCPLPAKVRRRPRRAEEGELERLYKACQIATWPTCEVAPVDWWRSLIVTLYNVALRRLDYLSLQWDQVDLRAGILDLTAHKTEKESIFPLHPVAVEHLQRIRTARALVWPWRTGQLSADPVDKRKTSLYRQWHRICGEARIEKKLVPHDLRKTSASQLFEQSPAAASELLQHSSITTTQESYANVSRQTRELMLARPQPTAFSKTDAPPDDDQPATIKFPGRAG